MPAPGFSTLLQLSGEGLPPYSARGLTQTLQPIAAGIHLRRTLNGKMLDLSLPQFRLYGSTVSGADQRPPFSYVPGTILTMKCLQHLSYRTVGGIPQRQVVAGSLKVEGAWTYYRPELVMIVTGWSITEEEWVAGVSWSMTFEEWQPEEEIS